MMVQKKYPQFSEEGFRGMYNIHCIFKAGADHTIGGKKWQGDSAA